MFSDDELARVISIKKKLDDIFSIVNRHHGIVKALNDIEGQPAILMLLVAISEQVDKLKKQDSKILDNYSEADIKGIFSVRNFIAHDYDGVNLAIIEDIFRYKLPNFLKITNKILEENQ